MDSGGSHPHARSRLQKMKRASLSAKDCGRAANRMGEMISWLGVHLAKRDLAMLGDCASLYMRIPYVWRVLDDLLTIPLKGRNLGRITRGIGTFWAEMDNLHALARDLVGPLDRFHTAALRVRENREKKTADGLRSEKVKKGPARKRK